jgi:hypothetical protein
MASFKLRQPPNLHIQDTLDAATDGSCGGLFQKAAMSSLRRRWATLHGEHVLCELPVASRRVGCLQRLNCGAGALRNACIEDRGDERVTGREASVQGRVADPGPAGDLVERRIDAALGEGGPRRV